MFPSRVAACPSARLESYCVAQEHLGRRLVDLCPGRVILCRFVGLQLWLIGVSSIFLRELTQCCDRKANIMRRQPNGPLLSSLLRLRWSMSCFHETMLLNGRIGSEEAARRLKNVEVRPCTFAKNITPPSSSASSGPYITFNAQATRSLQVKTGSTYRFWQSFLLRGPVMSKL